MRGVSNDASPLCFLSSRTKRFSCDRVIREEGGKMYMAEKKWKQAYEEFYEGFRGYQVR